MFPYDVSGQIDEEIGANVLVLRLQPDERVQLFFHTKSPGSRLCLRNVLMDFSYSEGYKGSLWMPMSVCFWMRS